MHDHLLSGLMDGQQLTQLHERLLARMRIRREQHLVEHVLDEIVLCLEKRHDLVGRLNNHFGHSHTSAFPCAYPGAMRLNAAPLRRGPDRSPETKSPEST